MIGDKNLSVSYIVCYALGEGQSKMPSRIVKDSKKVKKIRSHRQIFLLETNLLVMYFLLPITV